MNAAILRVNWIDAAESGIPREVTRSSRVDSRCLSINFAAAAWLEWLASREQLRFRNVTRFRDHSGRSHDSPRECLMLCVHPRVWIFENMWNSASGKIGSTGAYGAKMLRSRFSQSFGLAIVSAEAWGKQLRGHEAHWTDALSLHVVNSCVSRKCRIPKFGSSLAFTEY